MITPFSDAGKKAVLVISSHVVRGTVGNRAVGFALEALGHPVWALPTVTLPWHPGHGPATRIVASHADFAALCDELANAPWHGEIAGVITGFMADSTQVEIVGELVGRLKSANGDLVYLCDPVMGDFSAGDERPAYGKQGRLYVSAATAGAIREILLPQAHIATPNLYELGWLAGQVHVQNQSQLLAQARQLARALEIDSILVTSVPGLMRGHMGSVLVENNQAIMSEHKALEKPPNGPGDLTSALFLSHYLQGMAGHKNLEKTTASVFEILARTASQGADELALESNLISLSRPMAMVNMRRLTAGGAEQ